MRKLLSFVLMTTVSWTALGQSLGEKVYDEKNPLTASAQLTPFDVGPGQIAQVEVKVSLPKGYRAYEDQFKLKIKNSDGFQISNWQVSPTKEIDDKFTKK